LPQIFSIAVLMQWDSLTFTEIKMEEFFYENSQNACHRDSRHGEPSPFGATGQFSQSTTGRSSGRARTSPTTHRAARGRSRPLAISCHCGCHNEPGQR
jgi:hypothetical protein